MISNQRGTITGSAARELVGAAEAEATRLGLAVSVAVCDEAGHLMAFGRMDGGSFAAGPIAQDKAYSAAAFGMPTSAWFDVLAGDPPLREGMLTSIDRLCTLGGGVPVLVDGGVVGAIGVSGGTYEQDGQIAEAAVASLGA